MKKFETHQEEFWAGEFGDEYINRNRGNNLLTSNIAMFSKIFSSTCPFDSLIEFGSNIGLNLRAIHTIKPDVRLSAIEINEKAVEDLHKIDYVSVYPGSILDFRIDYQRDISLTKGVLIHINPDKLSHVYDLLYNSAKMYIIIAEYYSQKPVEVTYRNNKNVLFKRDFAGEMLDKYKNLRLRDYGFIYRRDLSFPQDDVTWFLLEKLA